MLKRVWLPSPNYSSRQGANVRLIVLHSAEGARTFQELGNFFGSSRSRVSSHVGADDTFNTVGEYVRRDKKAWTQGNFNPVAVSIEMCAYAAWSVDEWFRHGNLLVNTARWIAEEAHHYGIPIVRLSSAQALAGGRGVCAHSDLGYAGGGHSDPGPNFPMNYVLTIAHGTVPLPKIQEESLITTAMSHNGTLHLFELKDDWIWYTYQPAGQLGWRGAQAGVGNVAGMHRFAPAKGVVSIDAAVAGDGTFHVFGRKTDGSIVFTYQKPDTPVWSGAKTGQVAGLTQFAPAP